jgi:hypothetical protein
MPDINVDVRYRFTRVDVDELQIKESERSVSKVPAYSASEVL